jgi:hypothetical protein
VVPAIEGIGTLVVAGSTTMIFDRNQRPGIRRLVQEIRPISAGLDAAPPAKLPRAALPRGFWHRVRPVESVYRRTHSVRATARALGLSTRAVRERLTIARRLRKLGPFGRARC